MSCTSAVEAKPLMTAKPSRWKDSVAAVRVAGSSSMQVSASEDGVGVVTATSNGSSATLTLTDHSPVLSADVSLTAAAGTLTFTAYNPTVALGGLGLVIDPTVESLTAEYTMTSSTTTRGISSLTTARTIHNK